MSDTCLWEIALVVLISLLAVVGRLLKLIVSFFSPAEHWRVDSNPILGMVIYLKKGCREKTEVYLLGLILGVTVSRINSDFPGWHCPWMNGVFGSGIPYPIQGELGSVKMYLVSLPLAWGYSNWGHASGEFWMSFGNVEEALLGNLTYSYSVITFSEGEDII